MSSNPVYPWEQPRKPWELFWWIFLQFMIILVDAESKWPASDTNEKCCSEQHNTVEVLRSLFSRFGILHQLYSIRQWFTIVYKQFCEWNGTQYPLVAPYRPSSNGEAEKFIQTFKVRLDTRDFMCNFCRRIPHPVTGKTPAELILFVRAEG